MNRNLLIAVILLLCIILPSCVFRGTYPMPSEPVSTVVPDGNDSALPPPSYPDDDTEPETEPLTESETKPVTDSVTEPQTEQETESETFPETEAPTGPTVSEIGPVPGTGILYRQAGEKGRLLIAIDPGHQDHSMNDTEPNAPGSDVMKAKATSGTQGAFSGIPEHELNLSVALLLRDALLSRGYSVLMIRETGSVSISNAERAVLASENGAEALIRIHANGAADPSVNGALTMCQTRRNPYNGEGYEEARRLSELVLDSFCRATGMKALYVSETDTMTGINWCTIPATIVEMGFMSNESDDRKMAEDSFRSNAANGIADAIDRYFD